MAPINRIMWFLAIAVLGILISQSPVQAQSCTTPVTTPNLSLTPNSVSYSNGDTVTFACASGFSLIGAPSATCVNGDWNYPVPTCVDDCSDPGSPTDGSQTGTPTFKAYTTVTFECDSGFSLIGAPVITCIDGSWTLSNPTCSADCSNPGTPASGSQVGSPSYLLGTTVNFECDSGYDLIGASVISCEGGSWSRDVPTCLANCIDPGTPENGAQSGSYGNGGVVTYTCDSGFSLVGASAITCSAGIWSNSVPICEADCTDPGSVVNGRKFGGYTNGDTLSFECDAGFSLVGAQNITCRSGAFDGGLPTCYADCVDPGTPASGGQSGTYGHADIVTFSCISGFELLGASQITCDDGTWSNSMPTCLANCTDPGTPDFGSQTGNYGNSEVLFFNCSEGYTLVGADQITCVDGDWSNIAPVCKANCVDPGTPAFGSQTGTYKHSDVLFFNCTEGYDLIGADQLTCNNGVWTNNIPTCQLINVPNPNEPTISPTSAVDESTTIDSPTTSAIEVDPTTAEEQRESTTMGITNEVTTAVPEQESTTLQTELDSTTPAEEKESTTLETEVEATTAVSEQESTTLQAELDSTTSAEEKESTTLETEVEVTTAPTEQEQTTLETELDSTTAAVGQESTTMETEVEVTTSVEQESTTFEADDDSTTEESENFTPTENPSDETTTETDFTILPDDSFTTDSDVVTTDSPSTTRPTRPPLLFCPPIWLHVHGMNRKKYKQGDKISFSCKPGFAVVGPKWIVCFDGEWSGPVPECRRSCEYVPPAPEHGESYFIPSARNPWDGYNWENLPPQIDHNPLGDLFPDLDLAWSRTLLRLFLSLQDGRLTWVEIFKLFLNGIHLRNEHWPWGAETPTDLPNIPWVEMYKLMPNGIPLGDGNHLGWTEMFQQFPNGFPLGGDTLPWMMPGNGGQGGMAPESEDPSSVMSGDEHDESVGQIPPDNELPWEGMLQMFFQWLTTEMSDGNLFPGGAGDGVLPGDGDSSNNPTTVGIAALLGLLNGQIPSTDLGNIPWQQLFSLFPDGLSFADGQFSLDQILQMFNLLVPANGNDGGMGGSGNVVPWSGVIADGFFNTGGVVVTWEDLYQATPQGLPLGGTTIPWEVLFTMFPNGPPSLENWSQLIPAGGFDMPNGESGRDDITPWSGVIPVGYLGVGDGSITWEDVYQYLPAGVPVGEKTVPWEKVFEEFPDGPPATETLYSFLATVQEDSVNPGDDSDEVPVNPWSGVIPVGYLDVGDGSITWEDVYQYLPDGIPVGEKTVPWEKVFEEFPDGPPATETLYSFLATAQEDSVNPGDDSDEVPVIPWSGVIPVDYLGIGNGILTWETLYQQLPKGFPFRNETIPWGEIFKAFPDGSPPLEDLLMFFRMTQAGDGMTPEDDSDEVQVNPWSGVIPVGYLRIGDGNVTWEDLYQQIPNGLSFGNYTVQWRRLFKAFPDGPPSDEVLLDFIRMAQEGSGMNPEEGSGDIPLRPWSGIIPVGYLSIGDGNVTWEDLYQQTPNGLQFGNYTVPWKKLFKAFPDGPPSVEALLVFLRMAQAGNGMNPEEGSDDIPLTPWSGIIPIGYLDIGDGSLTWESLFQRLPNGLPFGNYTIPWERLFITFPDGPPSVQQLVRLVMSRMNPGEAADGEGMLSSWGGIVPQGLLNLGDGRLTWEELYQAMPMGLPLGNNTIPWELLFIVFPNGPPPPEAWMELVQEGNLGQFTSNDENLDQQNGEESTSAIVPWIGTIPQGLLNIGDGSITWEDLARLMPDGLQFGNNNIEWGVLYMMFPNGPPLDAADWSGFSPVSQDGNNPLQEVIQHIESFPWEELLDVVIPWLPFGDTLNGETPGDQVSPGMAAPWTGVIPSGLFSLGDETLTWEQLMQNLPYGLPFADGVITWEALFELFPYGIPSELQEWPWLFEMAPQSGDEVSSGSISSGSGDLNQLAVVIQPLLDHLWSGQIVIDLISHFGEGEVPWEPMALLFPNGISFGEGTLSWEELRELYESGISSGVGGMGPGSGNGTGMRPDSGGESGMMPENTRPGSGMRPENGGGMLPESGDGNETRPGGGIRPDNGNGTMPGNGDGMRPGNDEETTPHFCARLPFGEFSPSPPFGGGHMMPDDGTGMMPEGGTGMMPEGGTGMMPEGGTGMMPEGGTGMMPEGGTGMMPEGGTGMMPEGGTGMMPEGGTGMMPEGETGMMPEGGTGMMPEGGTGMMPEGETGMMPEGGTGMMPEGGTGMMPEGGTGMMPEGGTGMMPEGETGMMPEGGTGMMPEDGSNMRPGSDNAWRRSPAEGDSVKFSCSPGFVIVGSPLLTCTCYGIWDNLPPMCKEVFTTTTPDYTRPFAELTTIDTPEDPCFSNPCAEKANSKCISEGDDSFKCPCLPSFSESEGQCVESTAFSGNLRVTGIDSQEVEFTRDLTDPSTQAFQELAQGMESIIDGIYKESDVSDQYLGSTVTGFSNGSIVVGYIAKFTEENGQLTNSSAVDSAFKASYMESVNSGRLNVTVDVAASGVKDLDECLSISTNDCSLEAKCINVEGSFTCECRFGFIDKAPEKPGRFCELVVTSTTPLYVEFTTNDIDDEEFEMTTITNLQETTEEFEEVTFLEEMLFTTVIFVDEVTDGVTEIPEEVRTTKAKPEVTEETESRTKPADESKSTTPEDHPGAESTEGVSESPELEKTSEPEVTPESESQTKPADEPELTERPVVVRTEGVTDMPELERTTEESESQTKPADEPEWTERPVVVRTEGVTDMPELERTTEESESQTKPADEPEWTERPVVVRTEGVTDMPELERTTEESESRTKPAENTTKATSVSPKTPTATAKVAPTEPTIDPCFSSPCASKANSECLSMDDGSYTCSCIGLFFDSNGVCVVPSAFRCNLRVTEIQSQQAEYTEELADPSSQAFQSLAQDMTSVIDSIYMESSVSDQYLGSTIFGFSSGSIVVDYIAHIDDASAQSTNSTVVESAFSESYMHSVNTGRLNVTADVAASRVTDFNECLSTTTNDCSVNASCINNEGLFTCECHSGLVDLAPGKPGRFCAAPLPKVCDNKLDIDCSPYATCYDTDTRSEGYSCQCLSGFRDQSPNISLMPGRVCEEICPSTNCFNGGSCVSVYETGETICRCPEGFDGSKCENVVESGLSDTLILVISLISVASLILIGITLLLCFTFYHRHTKESIKKLSLRSTNKRRETSRFMQDADVWDPIILDDRSSSSQQTIREPRRNDQMTTFSEPVRHDSHDDGVHNLDFIDEEVESLARTVTSAMSKLPEVERRMRREVPSLGNYRQEHGTGSNFVRPYIAPETIPLDNYLQDPRRYSAYGDDSRDHGYGRPSRSSTEQHYHHGNMNLQQDLRASRMYFPDNDPTMMEPGLQREPSRQSAQHPPASHVYNPAAPSGNPPPPPPPPPQIRGYNRNY